MCCLLEWVFNVVKSFLWSNNKGWIRSTVWRIKSNFIKTGLFKKFLERAVFNTNSFSPSKFFKPIWKAKSASHEKWKWSRTVSVKKTVFLYITSFWNVFLWYLNFCVLWLLLYLAGVSSTQISIFAFLFWKLHPSAKWRNCYKNHGYLIKPVFPTISHFQQNWKTLSENCVY